MKYPAPWHRCIPFILLLALTACERPQETVEAQSITSETACSLDGMILADFPGPKAQIHYASGAPEFFCDTTEMFSVYLQPEQKTRIVAIYTQDMGRTDWEKPDGHWIDARQAHYVLGSSKMGSMGPTLAAFARREAAEAFAGQFGGRVLQFAEVTPDMIDLSGGVIHDQHM